MTKWYDEIPTKEHPLSSFCHLYIGMTEDFHIKCGEECWFRDTLGRCRVSMHLHNMLGSGLYG